MGSMNWTCLWSYLWRFTFICLLVGMAMKGKFSVAEYIFDVGVTMFLVMVVIRIKDVIEFMES